MIRNVNVTNYAICIFPSIYFPKSQRGEVGMSTGCLLRHLADTKRPSSNWELQMVHTNTVENDIRETNVATKSIDDNFMYLERRGVIRGDSRLGASPVTVFEKKFSESVC